MLARQRRQHLKERSSDVQASLPTYGRSLPTCGELTDVRAKPTDLRRAYRPAGELTDLRARPHRRAGEAYRPTGEGPGSAKPSRTKTRESWQTRSRSR